MGHLPAAPAGARFHHRGAGSHHLSHRCAGHQRQAAGGHCRGGGGTVIAKAFRHRRSLGKDRKSTRLNSSHVSISYAVFCLKKKKKKKPRLSTKKQQKKKKSHKNTRKQ